MRGIWQGNIKRAVLAAVALCIICAGVYLIIRSQGNGPDESAIPAAESASAPASEPSAVQEETAPPEAPPVAVAIDFSLRSDPPLLKKFAQYNAGTLQLKSYPRDIGWLEEVDSQTFRVDLGMGAGLDRDFLARDVVMGTAEQPVYDFTSVDSLAELLNDLRVLPYYSWSYVPLPLQRDDDFRKLNTEIPNWAELYGDMLKAIAGHYRESGIRIGYHEVYNEPDLTEVFFQEPFSHYLEMYRTGSRGLREGDPDAVIGGPALAMGESTTNVMDFVEMVEKEKLPLDFFSFHSYWESSPFPAKLDNIRKVLGWYDDFKTTELHLNELNVVGGWQGGDSRLNGFAIAPQIFDVLREVLKESDITMVNWAQFMESQVADDAYGLIHRDGRKKAAYNVFKIYADMPEERVSADFGDDWKSEKEIGVLASGNANKAAAVLWNKSDEDRRLTVDLRNLPFAGGELRLYRIDGEHASALDGAPENLEVTERVTLTGGQDPQWSGTIPANGVVYLTLNESNDQPDFHPEEDEYSFARDVRNHYYFEDRENDNYSFFDRKQWKFYLGTGMSDTARSLVGVTAEQLPERILVTADESGGIAAGSVRSAQAFRIDFQGANGYASSVVFHDGVYEAERDVEEPFGTGKPADRVVQVDDFQTFEVRPADYAPKDWTGRAILSLELCDTGPGTRMEVSLRQ